MRFRHLFFVVAPTIVASAHLDARSQSNTTTASNSDNLTDKQILQLVLDYVNFEKAYYALSDQFTAEDWTAYNFSSWVPGRVAQMGEHVSAQLQLLTNSLGSDAPQPCEIDPGFAAVNNITYNWLSNACGVAQVAASMYIEMIGLVQDPVTRKVLASMLSTEARHNAEIYGPMFHGPPWTGPFDTPISLSAVSNLLTTIVAPNCSISSLPLPKLPTLVLDGQGFGVDEDFPGNYTISAAWNGSNQTTPEGLYVQLVDGLGHVALPLSSNYSFTVPQTVLGWAYASITNGSASDSPAVTSASFVHVDFVAAYPNPGWNNPQQISDVPLISPLGR